MEKISELFADESDFEFSQSGICREVIGEICGAIAVHEQIRGIDFKRRRLIGRRRKSRKIRIGKKCLAGGKRFFQCGHSHRDMLFPGVFQEKEERTICKRAAQKEDVVSLPERFRV
ncbi:MAG: hypothetical protein ACOYM3_31430, partial [Terrimicrobiaceae bacterium]